MPDTDVVFLKETIGPYSHAESTFNPLQVLLAAGVPTENITLLISMRDPVLTATSWLENFRNQGLTKRELLTNFIHAFETLEAMSEQATALGIKTARFAHEILGDPSSVETGYSALFRQLGVDFLNLPFVRNWRKLPSIDDPASGIVFPDEPSQYRDSPLHPIHERTRKSKGIRYYGKRHSTIDSLLGEDGIRILETSRVADIYDVHRRMTSEQLGITIMESTQLRDFRIRHPRSAEGNSRLPRHARR
jgi:hypothetical protein